MSPKKFRVKWEIDLMASGPLSAAKTAREIHLDTQSIASVFVVDDGKQRWEVDLLAPRRRRVRLITRKAGR